MTLALIAVSVLLSSVGQLFLKRAAIQVGSISVGLPGILAFFCRIVKTTPIWLGLFSYGASLAIWLAVLSRADLSYAWPLAGLSYVLVALFSWLLLGETITVIRWAGIAVITLGVFLVIST